MKTKNDRIMLTEILSELKVNKKSIVSLEVYLKEHKIDYNDYINELHKHKSEELTSGNLMDIAISLYEGNLYETEKQKLSTIIYERELMTRERYKDSTDSESKKLEEEELEENKKWYTEELRKLKKKYKKDNVVEDE